VNLPLLVWLLLSVIWGSTWLFIKIGLNEGLPPLMFAAIRFVAACIPLLGLLWIRKLDWPRRWKDWLLMGGTGVLTFTIGYGLVFWGENHISSGLTAILYTTSPLFAAVMAHWTLSNERLTWAKIIGALLGIGGVVIIFYTELRLEGEMAWWGSAAIILAAFFNGIINILIKRYANQLDPMMLTTVQMVAGVLPLLGIAWITEGSPFALTWTPLAWVALLYLAWMGSAFPFVLLYWLYKHMSVTQISLIALSSTLMAVVLGAVVLQENIGWHTVMGGGAVLLGLSITMGFKLTLPGHRANVPPT
jgi:drug/metabolite transporter (DMT)-like permease